MIRGKARALCAGLALCAVTFRPLGAQRGTSVFVAGVADAETGQPLEGAEVLLLGERRVTRANALGEARLDGVPRGSQLVRVRMLGYAPAQITVKFERDTTGAVFRLTRSVTTLSTVTIEADRLP